MESFDLLETILFVPSEGFYLLDLHLSRLERSALAFGYPAPNKPHIQDQLMQKVPCDGPQRVRLLYSEKGVTTIEHTALPPVLAIDRLDNIAAIKAQTPLLVAMDTEPTIDSVFLRHKTTQRILYTAARERMKDGVFDVVLWNNDHQVTETSIANLAVGSRMSDGGYMWKTPSLDCGNMVESKITTDDLILAQKNGDLIVCFNSVRKIYRVHLVLDYYSCVVVFMPVTMSTTVSSLPTLPNTTTPPVSNVHKRVKVTLACTVCRKKKVKCDGIQPSCSRCNTMGFSCHYSDPPKKRGPPKGQVEIISSRAHRIKSLRTGHCHKTYSVSSASTTIRCYDTLDSNLIISGRTKRSTLETNPILHLIAGAVDAVQWNQDTPGSHYLKNDFVIDGSHQWIDNYFTYFNILFPLLSRPHFTLALSQQKVEPLLLFAVYTLGSKYSDQETSNFLFERWQCILNMSHDYPPTLSTVQALVMMCWYSYLMGNMQSCSVLRQRLNQAAIYDLHLYQDPGPLMKTVDGEMHRRTFWVVYVTNHWLSSCFGDSFLVLPDVWHCQWPKLDDTQLDDNDDNNNNQVAGPQIVAFSEMIKLACLLDDMHSSCHSQQQEMVSRLTDWIVHLPPSLDYSESKDDSPPLPRIYHMLYYTLQIMLHQPFLDNDHANSNNYEAGSHSPDTINMARTICTNAANTIVHIAEQMIEHNRHTHLLHTVMTSITLATSVHLNTLSTLEPHDVPSLLSLDRSIRVLKKGNSTALSSTALGQLLDLYLLDHYGITLKKRNDDDDDKHDELPSERLTESSRSSVLSSPWETSKDDLLDTRLHCLLHTPPSSVRSNHSSPPLDPTWLHETGSILDWFSDIPYPTTPYEPIDSLVYSPTMELYAFMALC
ncbi:hypothetical protein [Absidia glauca]|uniref:Zn(2)-C6 fungal-type domain-containing protein n=1 Tax=Absidia glauca TaxID=4829 RepID=A0A168MTB0_ABSGL|nr:hypothetical protein [Absidia glauca]